MSLIYICKTERRKDKEEFQIVFRLVQVVLLLLLLLTRAKYCRPLSSDMPFLICMNRGCSAEFMVAIKSSSLSLVGCCCAAAQEK